jgi:hypothetical protein
VRRGASHRLQEGPSQGREASLRIGIRSRKSMESIEIYVNYKDFYGENHRPLLQGSSN